MSLDRSEHLRPRSKESEGLNFREIRGSLGVLKRSDWYEKYSQGSKIPKEVLAQAVLQTNSVIVEKNN